jgi:peroxiredoxin
MKRSLSFFIVWAILLNTPALLFSQNQSTLLIKGRDISASTTSIQLLKEGLLKDSMYTLPVQDGSFYALLDMDEGIQRVAILIGHKPVMFYASSGDVVDVTCDVTKNSLIKIEGANALKTRLLTYDVTSNSSFRTDSVFAYKVNKATDDAEKYRLCTYYYNKELNDLLSKKNFFKDELSGYINELYFSYADKMFNINLYQLERLTDTSAKRFPDGEIVPGPHHFEKISKTIFLQSPAYRQYLFNYFRFGKPDSSDVALMIQYSGDVKKSAPWKEYQKSKYINDPFIKDWFKAKSVVFSFNHYNLEEASKVMKLFLSECRFDQLKENVINTIKGFSIFEKGSKAPDFILQNELGKKVSLADFAGKVIYLNFWGTHCGPCITEIKNDLPLLRSKYKNIVIISICVEGKTTEWKNAITKYGMKYINLFDPTNKVMKEYSISSVPHNILINKQGQIFEYNAARPNAYIENNKSIDELIKE